MRLPGVVLRPGDGIGRDEVQSRADARRCRRSRRRLPPRRAKADTGTPCFLPLQAPANRSRPARFASRIQRIGTCGNRISLMPLVVRFHWGRPRSQIMPATHWPRHPAQPSWVLRPRTGCRSHRAAGAGSSRPLRNDPTLRASFRRRTRAKDRGDAAPLVPVLRDAEGAGGLVRGPGHRQPSRQPRLKGAATRRRDAS